VRINEFAAHTDYSDPLNPEYDSNDWIELFNAGENAVTLEHWYLSDRASELRLWAIPLQTIAAGSWLSFDEVSGFHSPITTGFGLNKAGEQIYLSHLPGDGNDRVVDAIRFEGQENGVSWGRYPDGGNYGGTMSASRGSANAAPARSVVITEVMYCPPSVDGVTDNLADEYVELFNSSGTAVDLFAPEGMWRLEGGVDWTFAAGTRLAPGETLLVVNFNPADADLLDRFRQTYGLTNPQLQIQGPYSGKLSNRSDRLGLERPQSPDLPGDSYSWVILDEVIYGNQVPWPEGALGTGLGLQRLANHRSGNDPANWTAATPTPGVVMAEADRDQDGMPDAWEELHGFDPDDPSDAQLDADGDGLSNLEEYWAGTDPRDPDSVLKFSAITWLAEGVRLEFQAMPGRIYRVEYDGALSGQDWLLLDEVIGPAQPAIQSVTDSNPIPAPFRIYRLRLSTVP
jgi:hypothetical protein